VSDSDPQIAEIIREIDAEHAAWLDMVGRLPADQLVSRPPGGWSILDMLLHVASWKENAVKVADMQAAPDAPSPAQEQTPAGILGLDDWRFNEDFMIEHRDWTLERSLEWSTKVHTRLIQALTDLPADRILGGTGPNGARLWYWSPAVIVSERHRKEAGDRFM
jgi:hypothetical protein